MYLFRHKKKLVNEDFSHLINISSLKQHGNMGGVHGSRHGIAGIL